MPARPRNFNSYGKECGITLNTFNVVKQPDGLAYQYDVSLPTFSVLFNLNFAKSHQLHYAGDALDYTKRVLLKKIWNSRAVTDALGQPDQRWIWDGNKLAWSGKKLDRDETRISVDLDAEDGRQPRPGARGNKHTLYLRMTRQVDFIGLRAFLDGQAPWSSECIDTINFFDHIMREWPSQRYTQIKKSFFQRGQQRFDLGGGVEAFKGVFASLRPVLDDKFNKSLAVNVDVANGTFWRAQPLIQAIGQMFNCSPVQFGSNFRGAKRDWDRSFMKRDLRRLRHVGVTATHTKPPTQWTIKEITNMDATEAKFPDADNANQQISVAQYFKKKYNITCMPGVPVVRMTKTIRGGAVYMPLDVLKIDENQRYNTKLDDKQTSQMINFAVTVPNVRWQAVMQGVHLLDWPNDQFLRHYGLQISTNPSKVKGRVLPPPTVQFGAGKDAIVNPSDLVKGRWQLQG